MYFERSSFCQFLKRGTMFGISLMIRLIITTLVGIFFAGCQPHDIDYFPDPIPKGEGEYSISSQESKASDQVWWAAFDDSKLDLLIREAIANSFDVMQAVARLTQASSLTRQAKAKRLPQLNLEASSRQEWQEGEDRERLNRIGGALEWEIDLFNRLGSAELARQSEQAARMEDIEAVRLSLSAEVAEAYFDAVEQRNQLKLLQNQIDTDLEFLELTRLRFDSGLTASVDVWQQSSQLAETESLVPPTEAILRVAENRLDVLIGLAPDALDRVGDEDQFVDIKDLPFLGVPSDLLLNRPDLRALRNELVAADAEIGQAIAERLPLVMLNGAFLYEDGLDVSGPVGFVLGSLVQPLIDWGARKAEVKRNRALYVERLALFSQVYLEAIESVENTLYLEGKQREFLDRLERRRGFLKRTVEETKDRYTNGLTDFLPVLTAIKELQRIERIILRQQRALLGFRIQLHRALGGNVSSS
jgi:NodT family efflux transporter outer membrane factor (OMF) lipoprotein